MEINTFEPHKQVILGSAAAPLQKDKQTNHPNILHQYLQAFGMLYSAKEAKGV